MTQPIDRDQLGRLIRHHQDNLYSSAHLMNPSTRELEKQTVQALQHYRILLDVIDSREPDHDPTDRMTDDMMAGID